MYDKTERPHIKLTTPRRKLNNSKIPNVKMVTPKAVKVKTEEAVNMGGKFIPQLVDPSASEHDEKTTPHPHKKLSKRTVRLLEGLRKNLENQRLTEAKNECNSPANLGAGEKRDHPCPLRAGDYIHEKCHGLESLPIQTRLILDKYVVLEHQKENVDYVGS